MKSRFFGVKQIYIVIYVYLHKCEVKHFLWFSTDFANTTYRTRSELGHQGHQKYPPEGRKESMQSQLLLCMANWQTAGSSLKNSATKKSKHSELSPIPFCVFLKEGFLEWISTTPKQGIICSICNNVTQTAKGPFSLCSIFAALPCEEPTLLSIAAAHIAGASEKILRCSVAQGS